jgi:hypothetical protein
MFSRIQFPSFTKLFNYKPKHNSVLTSGFAREALLTITSQDCFLKIHYLSAHVLFPDVYLFSCVGRFSF